MMHRDKVIIAFASFCIMSPVCLECVTVGLFQVDERTFLLLKFRTVYSSDKQTDFANYNHFLSYPLIDFDFVQLELFFLVVSLVEGYRKRGYFFHLLKAWSGYRWVCVVCGQLHAAVWRLYECCCHCCCCGCCSKMSLWHRDAVSLADRQAIALVTAASCHLGLYTEKGGQGHANGRTGGEVMHTLAY